MNSKVIISEHTKVVLIDGKIKDEELLNLLNFCKRFTGETDKAIFISRIYYRENDNDVSMEIIYKSKKFRKWDLVWKYKKSIDLMDSVKSKLFNRIFDLKLLDLLGDAESLLEE